MSEWESACVSARIFYICSRGSGCAAWVNACIFWRNSSCISIFVCGFWLRGLSRALTVCMWVSATGQSTANQTLDALPYPLCTPCEQAAVVNEGFFHVDASVFLRGHDVPVMTPQQLHWWVQVGSGALQGEAVTMENKLPPGGDELKQGHLQRSIWNTKKI